MPTIPSGQKITVVFLLYNASKTVTALVDSIRAQKRPGVAEQSEWLEVMFMDDRSPDNTIELLRGSLAKIGSPAHYKVVPNEKNLGLSRTLNKAFGLTSTPYVLTCHCDCFFGVETYVSDMLDLLIKTSDAGAITGQQTIPQPGSLPFAEKVNLIANLMDLFPPQGSRELLPVGFAEGRCDAFRMEALQAVGFYDTTLRLAGEDQVIASRMREKGFQAYQAPKLPYVIRASDSQDTLRKLMKHQQLFGRAHPYILLRARGTQKGIVGEEAGANRQSRTLLRGLQIASTGVVLLAIAAWIAGEPWWLWLPPVLGTLVAKYMLFRRHLELIPLSFGEWIRFVAFQPCLDAWYTLGLIQGLWLVLRGSEAKPIS